jgi:hypothetical protein
MSKQPYILLSMLLALTSAGCGADSRAEIDKLKSQLAEARAELTALQTQAKQGYLEELERLDALRSKGSLTQEEFEARKKVVLQEEAEAKKKAAQPPADKPRPNSIEDLAKQLRMLQALSTSFTISQGDWQKKKALILQNTLGVNDLKKDLELVQALQNEFTITQAESDLLKKRLLGIDQAKK